MHMAVDAAGQDQKAGGIDNFFGSPEVCSQRRDLAAADTDIAAEGIRRCRHRAAADNCIESHAVTRSRFSISDFCCSCDMLGAVHPMRR